MRVDPTTMLERPRLVEALRTRWDVPVTLVVAPAGYGKTTLLGQAIATNAVAPVGLDCRLAGHTDLTTASALGMGLCRAVDAPVTAAGRGPEAPTDVAAAIGAALWRRSPQQVCVMLDDVHEVPVRSGAARLLRLVVAALPANGHLVLAGRARPPVPLGRLAVERRLGRLDAADMAFTADEVADFAALRRVDPARVAPAGGWPAMAELMATGSAADTHAYIAEEVLPEEPEDSRCRRRHDLALLAHVGPVDDALARAALDRDVDVTSLLAGVPLVREEPAGEHRLHDLWRSVLFDVATPDEVAAARRRAGRELVRRGRAAAAVRLLAEAGAWDEVAVAVVDALGAARPPVPRDVLAGWSALLPPDLRDTATGWLLAGVAGAEAHPAEAWALLDRAAGAFAGAGDAAGELACLVHLGELAWWSEQVDRLGAVAQRLIHLEAEGHAEAIPLACLARALLHDVANDGIGMLAELDRIRPGALDGTWVTVLDALRSTALLQIGNSRDSLDNAEASLRRASPVHAPLLEATRMHALWAQGRLDDVLVALPDLVDRFRRSGYRNATALAAAHCSLAHALRGHGDAAAYLARARSVGASADAPMVRTALAIAGAAVAVSCGDEAGAADLLAADVERHPVGAGLSAAAHQRSLALSYVLVPATRARWDGADVGSDFLVARDLARMLVAVRESGRLPADAPPMPAPDLARAHLPVRWVAELGLAAVAAESDDAWSLLEDAWPDTRPAVAEMAERAGPPLRKAARTTLAQLAVTPTEPLELLLLGPVELWRAGSLVDTPGWRRERVRSLLAHLTLNERVRREQLAEDLWPTLDAVAQSRNLRVTLTYLLQALEPGRRSRDASYFVRQHGPHVHLHTDDWMSVDVRRFDDACRRANDSDRDGRPSDALAAALDAVALWRGEPTELASEHWAVAPLEQRRLGFATVAVRAGELLLARGALDESRDLVRRALSVDPWMEAAHRLAVASYRAAGDHAGAHRAMAAYRDAVHDLGLTPDEATVMVERLLEFGPAPTIRQSN